MAALGALEGAARAAPGLVDRQDEMGRTALHHAALGGHERCAEFLLNTLGCDKDVPDRRQLRAAGLAHANGHAATLQLILAAPSLSAAAVPTPL